MPINAPEPTVIPAIPAKTLPSLWFRQFIMNIPSPTMAAPMTCEYGPWSGDPIEDPVWRDGQGNDLAQRLVIPDIWTMRAAVPSFDAAYRAFITAIPEVMAYLAEQERLRLQAEEDARLAAEEEAAAAAGNP
jgi:hypothetical protein